MFHSKRRWVVAPVESPEELARRPAMFRYSMLTLLLVVLVLGVFCAVLVNPSTVRAALIYTCTLIVLSAATLTAIAKGRASPFIWGFAVMGWIYFAVWFIALAGSYEYLVTHWPVRKIGEAVMIRDAIGIVPLPSGPKGVYVIGHCLWTFIFATVGGLAACWLQRPSSQQIKDP